MAWSYTLHNTRGLMGKQNPSWNSDKKRVIFPETLKTVLLILYSQQRSTRRNYNIEYPDNKSRNLLRQSEVNWVKFWEGLHYAMRCKIQISNGFRDLYRSLFRDHSYRLKISF